MISVEHVRTMARYNEWQNRSLYGAADALGDAERRRERGAFFGSIHGTLSHLLWADRIWMSRFLGLERPPGGIKESPGLYPDWEDLKRQRATFDQSIIGWADALDPDWLQGDLTWRSGASGSERTKPRWFLVTHFFNHETHHRGQVHAMLTQAGARPDDTDLMLMKA
jgi:uncharacterized damage-inducible protein DinB